MNIQSENRDLFEKIGLVLVSSLLYAITYVAIDLGTQTIKPATLTVMRLVTAAVIYIILIKVTGVRYSLSRRGVFDLFIIGVLNIGLPFLFTANAISFISSSLIAIMVNIMPVFTVVLAHIILKDEKISLIKLAGTITAVIGASLLLIRSETGLSTGGGSQGLSGQVLILASCLANALGIIYMRLRFRDVPTTILAGGQVFASLVVMAPFALLTEGFPNFQMISLTSWLAMLVAAISAPVAAYWLLTYMVNKFSASLGGISGIVTPFFSVFLGIFFLHEVITLPIAIGTALLIAGVFTLNRF